MPQGSILGTLLFVYYTKDLPNFSNHLRPFIYADDTALIAKGNSIEEINRSLQLGFDELNKWFAANNLSVNPSKSKVMLFRSKRSQMKNVKLDVRSGDVVLETVDTMKYLGVNLDEHLTFEEHTDKLISKVSQRESIVESEIIHK